MDNTTATPSVGIWLVAYEHYVDDCYGGEDLNTEFDIDEGFFTTKDAALARVDELNAGTRQSHERSVASAKKYRGVLLRDYRKREKQRAACLAAGVAMPPALNEPAEVQVQEFRSWALRNGGGLYVVEQVKPAAVNTTEESR